MTVERGELREGDLIGGIEIEARIGSGGFGVVYRGRDPRGAKVAVKVLTPDVQDDADLGARLMKEATLMAEIEADNVVRFHAAGKDGARIWLAMEYVPGGTLRDKLPKGRPIEVEQALRWARQIAEGCAELHKIRDASGRPVVHRDLKPENVLLTRDGLAKVADFGIAKFRTSLKSTSSNEAIGTPLYMAPEQMGGTAEIDERADVFALGVMVYEMLSGKRPAEVGHDGELTLMEKVTRSITQAVVPLPELNPDVPDYVWTIVERAVQKKREHRFVTMRELADDLVAALKRVRRERGKRPSFAAMSLPEPSASRIGAPLGRAELRPQTAGAPPPPSSTPRTALATATTAPAPDFEPGDTLKLGEPDGATSREKLSTLAASSRSLRLRPARRFLSLPVLAGGMLLGVGVGALAFRSWTSSPTVVEAVVSAAAPDAAGADAGASVQVAADAAALVAEDAGAGAAAAGWGTTSAVVSEEVPQPTPKPLPQVTKKPPSSAPATKAPATKPGAQPKKCTGLVCDPDF